MASATEATLFRVGYGLRLHRWSCKRLRSVMKRTHRTMPATKTPGKRLITPKAAPLFRLRRSRIQGRGAFATRPIRKGQRVAEYVGEHITNDEANARYVDTAMERHHTFLFAIDDDIAIDGARGGNDSKYFNHSCMPNCESVIVGKRVFIVAVRAIDAGSELTYDYRYERNGFTNAEAREQYPCRCGTPECRGTIMLPREKKARKKPNPSTKTASSKKKAAPRKKSSRSEVGGPDRPRRA